jgi:Cof subfamily protein (haloacid dehalogenase superfamily)
MKDKIKLIALDIDGTIMNSKFQISERMKETIFKAINSGIYVVLATGRMYSATVPIAAGLGIKTPLITYQGSMIREYYNSDEVLLHYTVDSDLSRLILQELRKFDLQVNVYLDDELFVEDETHILREYAARRHIVYHKVDSFEKIIDFSPTKILAINKTPEETMEIRNYLRKKFLTRLNITNSTPLYCEIVNNQASKGNSILYLADKWGFKQSEIMVIGDQDNDKDMLDIAGVAVAMGNGPDSLKESADFVTDTVDNDGAALAIEKFALELTDEPTI